MKILILLKYSKLKAAYWFLILLLNPFVANAMTELLLQLDTSQRFDSNPLRFTKNADITNTEGVIKKDDSILAADIRAAVIHRLDSPETRIVFIGQLGRRDYSQLSQLDNTEYNYRTAFEWRYGHLWTGLISFGKEQQLYNYLDGSLTSREMTHANNINGELNFQVSPDIEIPFALRKRQVTYDNPTNWLFDSQENIADVGVRYKSTSRSTVRSGIRSNEVTFPRRTEQQSELLDTRYRDNEFYIDSEWQYSILTRFSGRISALNRNYARLLEKDFSALTTEIKVNHEYSPKTNINIEIWNRPYGTTDRITLYTLTTGLQGAVSWRATPKTRLTFQVNKEIQRYQSVELAPTQSNPKLNRTRWGGGLVYSIERDVRVYFDFLRDRLDRGSLGAPIDQNTVKLGIEYSFENSQGMAQRTGLAGRR